MTESNLPTNANAAQDSNAKTLKLFNGFFEQTVSLKEAEWDIVYSFFFKYTDNNPEATRSLSEATITSAIQNGIMPVEVITDLQKMDKLEVNELLANFFNTTRRNTSLLGIKIPATVPKYVARNILP